MFLRFLNPKSEDTNVRLHSAVQTMLANQSLHPDALTRACERRRWASRDNEDPN